MGKVRLYAHAQHANEVFFVVDVTVANFGVTQTPRQRERYGAHGGYEVMQGEV